MCYNKDMTNTETSQFSTDPIEVGTTLVQQGRTVNGLPVIALQPAPGRGGLVVLCHRADEPTRTPDFVTWIIWRTDEGKIAAQSGHYDMTLEEGLVDLHERAGSLPIFRVTIQTTIDAAGRSF